MKNEIKAALGGLAVVAAAIGGTFAYPHYISRNLDEGAVEASAQSNLGWNKGWLLPKLTNKDIDGDGKYESIIVYKIGGKRVFQEVTVGRDGKLKLSGIVRSYDSL